MNCKGPNLFDAECVSLISTVSVQKSYCNVIPCNTKCYIQYNDTLCRLWCWRTATALVWWHQPGALKVLSTNKGRCPKRKLCLPKTNWKEGEGGTYSTDSYFPDFVFVFVSFMINIKVTNMKSTAEKLLSTNPKSVKNRHFCMNKNTKCPIDAHCHRHCRRDPRIAEKFCKFWASEFCLTLARRKLRNFLPKLQVSSVPSDSVPHFFNPLIFTAAFFSVHP